MTQTLINITDMTNNEVADLLNVNPETETDYSAYFNQSHEDIADVFREEEPTLPTYKKFMNMLIDGFFKYTNKYYLNATNNVRLIGLKTMFMKMDKTKANELLDLAEHYKEFNTKDLAEYRELALPAKVYNKELNK